VRLSTKGRYAVMAMVELAKNGGALPVALAEIAERQEISLSYLEQLFGKLRATVAATRAMAQAVPVHAHQSGLGTREKSREKQQDGEDS